MFKEGSIGRGVHFTLGIEEVEQVRTAKGTIRPHVVDLAALITCTPGTQPKPLQGELSPWPKGLIPPHKFPDGVAAATEV